MERLIPFYKKHFALGKQVFRFLIIGGICFVLVMSLLFFFVEYLIIEKNLANILASLIVIIINYFLNAWFVFETGRHSRWKEFTGYFLFAMIGFGLNVLLFGLMTKYIPIHYGISKAIIVVLIAVFNFTTRKFLIFKG